MRELDDIVKGCQNMDRKAQKVLYDRYSPILFGMAMRYASCASEAEDMLQEAFINIFKHVKQYEGHGSFEGWMKRILINAAIGYIRKHKKHINDSFDEIQEIKIKDTSFETRDFTKEELMSTINELPEGFRLVFNLYAIEGYKHREIAEMLGIQVGTSKSQYSRARKILMNKLQVLSKMPEDRVS